MIRGSWRDTVRLAALVAAAFVLAHDLVFLLSDGRSIGLALARTGHGDQWTATVIIVAGLALALGVAGGVRLARLSKLARELEAGDRARGAGRPADLARHVGRAWLLILPAALVLFVAVENLEHLSVGLPAPGLSVLGSSQYHSVLAVFAFVALLAAVVDGLYRWRRDGLVARIEAARARHLRRPTGAVRAGLPWLDRHHSSTAGQRILGRAPPAVALA